MGKWMRDRVAAQTCSVLAMPLGPTAAPTAAAHTAAPAAPAGVINLFDERYLTKGAASLGTLGYEARIFARPRHWYVQASVAF